MSQCLQCGEKCKRSRNKFCSKKCYTKFQKKTLMVECKQCNKECRNKFCSKKCSMLYRRSHKDEYHCYHQKLINGQSKRKKKCSQCKQCAKTNRKWHHKFCSRKCAENYRKSNYDEYKESYMLTRTKVRKLIDIECEYCGALTTNKRFCSIKCFVSYRIEHYEEFVVDRETCRMAYQKFKKNEIAYHRFLQINSDRMKRNNPMHNPDILQKAKESCAKYWDEHPEEKRARIQRFMQAPMRSRGKKWKPTSLEQKIINLNIPGLSYTGDGSVFITIGEIGNKRKKNPDFLLKGKKRVIEVGDIEYWHTQDEIDQTVRDYESIGYKCLYLTNRDLDLQGWEKSVKEFCL